MFQVFPQAGRFSTTVDLKNQNLALHKCFIEVRYPRLWQYLDVSWLALYLKVCNDKFAVSLTDAIYIQSRAGESLHKRLNCRVRRVSLSFDFACVACAIWSKCKCQCKCDGIYLSKSFKVSKHFESPFTTQSSFLFFMVF